MSAPLGPIAPPPLPPEPPAVPAPRSAPTHEPDPAPAASDRLLGTLSFERMLALLAIVAGVVLYAVDVPILAAAYDVHVAIAFGVALLTAGAIPLALVAPWTAVAASLVGAVLFTVFGTAGPGDPWPVGVPQLLALCALIAVLALRGRRTAAAWAWAGGVIVPLAFAFLPDRGATPDGIVANIVTVAGVSALALVAALVAQVGRSRVSEELERGRRAVEVEHERRVVAEERTRIARELHDVVAHSLSIVQVQATSAPYRLPDLDPAAADEFRAIAASARTAMGELRGLLSVLRAPDADVETAPQPGLAELPTLVASVERAGLPVQVRIEADGADDGLAGRAAYRIVQESLSNVLRHAPGAATEVLVQERGGTVLVTVRNQAPPEPAPSDTRGGGHGIIGMRERARALGGSLDAGPTPEGGFRVHGELPQRAGDAAGA
ncbi:sensor histidine kinase [Agromyces seonyuensis]|uniref:histidine kinase n=1 Tax=Agromyces seonyuensis TaxID=2662446 RepID=A0A6I4NT73_9MICO|nr:histidine kinase [Agromyces seonyuensis]MWB97638.1 histidine kinase [Agromyces seonyuensis]